MAWNSRPGWTYTEADLSNQFHKLGNPGRYYKSITVVGGTQSDFTGSQYGYGAVICGTGADSIISLSDGGSIPAATLIDRGAVDLSVSKVSGGSAGNVYVLQRQQ